MTWNGRTDQACESLRLFYREHTDQARHYDMLRHAITAFSYAFAAGVLAFVGPLNKEDNGFVITWAAVALVAVGLLGAPLSELHWRSNRKHVVIARAFRMSLQKALENPSSDVELWETDASTHKIIKRLADTLGKRKEGKDALAALETEHVKAKDEQGKTKPKDLLDRHFAIVAMCDFRTIRDYGDARHQIERLYCDYTPSSWLIATCGRWPISSLPCWASCWFSLCSFDSNRGMSLGNEQREENGDAALYCVQAGGGQCG